MGDFRNVQTFQLCQFRRVSNYSSVDLDNGLRLGSFDKKPNIKRETKKLTVVYTRTFNDNIETKRIEKN